MPFPKNEFIMFLGNKNSILGYFWELNIIEKGGIR